MNENFLNSFAFEQMAREYNKKYSSSYVNILQVKKDDKLSLKIENIFSKVFRLFYLFDVGFKKDYKFKDFFDKKEKFKINFQKAFKEWFNKDFIVNYDYSSNKIVNNKVCSILMLEIFMEILFINIEQMNNCYLELQQCFKRNDYFDLVEEKKDFYESQDINIVKDKGNNIFKEDLLNNHESNLKVHNKDKAVDYKQREKLMGHIKLKEQQDILKSINNFFSEFAKLLMTFYKLI